MSICRLVIVRHGQSVWNVNGRLTGSTDVELTDLGREQAAELRPQLVERAFTSVVSSDLRRASETARLAFGRYDRLDARLREFDFGDLEGAVWRELDTRKIEGLRDFEVYQAPGGESLETFRRRVFACIDELGEGVHLIFAHGGVVRAIMKAAGGEDRFVGNCEVVEVEWPASS